MAKVLSRLDILLHANTANYQREMTRATNETRRQLRSIADYGQEVSSQLKKAFVQIGGLGAMIGLGMGIISAQWEFDVLNAQLITATGSVENASRAMQQLQEFAKTTPYGLNQAVEGFAKLKNLGLNASIESLNSFGNTAAAMGKDLMQLIEAVADASTFEFERLKEFGIKSEQQKDKIAFTFQGITTEVTKNAQAIEQYLLKIGNVQFGSAMETRAKTLDGAISALGDSWQGFLRSLGNANIGTISYLGVVKESVVGLSNALDWASENMNVVILGLATTTLYLGRTMISTGTGVATSWVRAMTGATTASIANAFSVQSQITAYEVLELKILSLSTGLGFKIVSTIHATTNAVAYARSLVGLATSFNTATASARLHTLALAGVTTAKRGAMGVGILATRAITGLGGAFMSLGRIITAHPILVLTAVIGAVIARTEGLSGAVKSLGDAFSVSGILAVDFVGGVVDGLGTAWTVTANYFDNLMGGSANATSFAQTAFGGFFAGTHKGFVGVLQITARVFDLAGASVVTFTQYAWKNISSLGTATTNVFKGIGNFIAFVLESVINDVTAKINFVIDGVNTISGVFGGGTVAKLSQVSIGRMEYGETNFGFGGFTASVAKNNAHYVENQVDNAYDKVQSSAKQAHDANLGLAGSMADVAKGADKAAGRAKKIADANKLAGKSADEASKALKELDDNLQSQLAEWERAKWDMSTPFISELSKIEFEITSVSGKFHIASDDMKNNLRKLAREMDIAKANFELSGTRTDAVRQMKLLSSKGSKYLEMAYDLQDTANALHLADDEQKKQILTTMVNLEVATKAWEIQDKILENQKEIIALGTPDGMARELLLVEQERADTLEKYNYLLKDGYTEQFALIEQKANALAEQQKQIFVTKQYNDLIQSLNSEEEKRLDTLKSQLDVLLAHQQVMGVNLDIERAKQLISQNGGLATPTNHYDELNAKTSGQYASLDTGLQALLDNERLTEEERIKIKEWGASERAKIEQAHSTAMNSLILSDSENMFGSLASIAKDGLGEQSRLYRAMFAMQQGFAIAQASLAMQQAISQGLAKGFPEGLADMALAVSHGAKIVSAIKSVVMPVGQAHDGIMSVPKSGTWNLEKGERVLPRHTAKALDDKLASMSNGGGQVVINQHITINTDGSHDVRDDSQNQMGQALKTGVLAIVHGEMRQGGSIYNFVKNGR